MLSTISTEDCNADWLPALHEDFKHRFIPLLGFNFRDLSIPLALEILNPKVTGKEDAVLGDQLSAEVYSSAETVAVDAT